MKYTDPSVVVKHVWYGRVVIFLMLYYHKIIRHSMWGKSIVWGTPGNLAGACFQSLARCRRPKNPGYVVL